ncbi:MAG: arylsulfatase [Porticoccaceae bacterium]|jgi:arylsulfatase A-like enzyme|nr:arylsulfatase [Porticoccaceae bacterium]MBT3797545.1 arylsulfatase [Porticoccaceae bacterium]MBT4165363.1 arylsulfatase [Porticoccaceae bacterium]MBT4590868.1 arylsulfatase [Porticoccaceae bacterium]MBT6027865.1 arylsulfatase [Porticoccaceae bacterium]
MQSERNITKKMRLIKLSRAWSLTLGLLVSAFVAANDRPNVVLMVADDLGWADVGYHGSPIQTPAIDGLVAQGVALERFYAAPICSPTRAGLLTARDPVRLGIAYDQIHPWYNAGLGKDEYLLSEVLQDAGYQTGIIGKWHLGHSQQQQVPNSQGFDYFFGHLHTNTDFYNHRRENGHDLQRNGVSVSRDGEYLTHIEASQATAFIEARDKGKPFFLYVPFTAPHSPMQAPAKTIEKYKHLSRQGYQRVYAAMVDEMDMAIGSILGTIESEGLADNTIVVFMSDNGGSNYFGGNNKPLRGQKGQTFEGGIRVPAVVRWPNHLAAGTVLDQTMSYLDLFPTIVSATGIQATLPNPIDGQDMWPALNSGSSVKRKAPLFFVSEIPVPGLIWTAVIDGSMKLVQIVREGQTNANLTSFLFDITKDPNETHNLAAINISEVARLAELIRQRRALHPLAGTRGTLVPHPGWLPPVDWARAVQSEQTLQSEWTNELPFSEQLIDQIGDRGVLVDEETREKLRQQSINTQRELGKD